MPAAIHRSTVRRETLVIAASSFEFRYSDTSRTRVATVPGARQRQDGTWLVDAALTAHDLKSLLKLDQPLPHEGDAEFKTLGGFVLAQFGRIPKEGDLFDWAGWRFEVVDMDHLRIDKVLVSRSPVAGQQPPAQ